MTQKVMIIRRRVDGSITVTGPPEHTFSARLIAREAGKSDGFVKVHITVGDRVYELLGFAPIFNSDGSQAMEQQVGGDPVPRVNFTAWMCRQVTPEGVDQSGDYESAPDLEGLVDDG